MILALSVLLAFICGAAIGAFLFLRRVSVAEKQAASLHEEVTRLNERGASLERLAETERTTREKVQSEFKLAAIETLREVKGEAAREIESDKKDIASSVGEMKSRLEEATKKIDQFEKERSRIHGSIDQSLQQVLAAGESIRLETSALKRALTSSVGVRGPWGQSVLEELLEKNNLVRGEHFETQVTLSGDSNGPDSRPDFVVHLPGGRRLIIDAKEVGGEYILAQETDDPNQQKERYEKLAQNIRINFGKLSKKEYQENDPAVLPFTVMFIPNEGAIRAAFYTDPELFRDAAEKKVILASPMTVIPLIHLIKQAWQQEQLTKNARELGGVVEELGSRLAVFMGHLESMADGIQRTADSYEKAQRSWQSRVSPQMDKVKSLGGKLKDTKELPSVQIQTTNPPGRKAPPKQAD